MNQLSKLTCTIGLSLLALAGCKNSQSEATTSAPAPTVAYGGTLDVKLPYAGTAAGKIGPAYAFVKTDGDEKQIELYLFNEGASAKSCERLVDDPQSFDKPLPDGTKALVWHKTSSGGEYKAGGEGSSGYLYVFYPSKDGKKSSRDYASGDLPLVKITSLTQEKLEGSIEDAKGDEHVKATFTAKVCPS